MPFSLGSSLSLASLEHKYVYAKCDEGWQELAYASYWDSEETPVFICEYYPSHNVKVAADFQHGRLESYTEYYDLKTSN